MQNFKVRAYVAAAAVVTTGLTFYALGAPHYNPN